MPISDQPPADIGIGVLDTLRLPFVVAVLFVLIVVTGILTLCAVPFEIIDWAVTKVQTWCGYRSSQPNPEAV